MSALREEYGRETDQRPEVGRPPGNHLEWAQKGYCSALSALIVVQLQFKVDKVRALGITSKAIPRTRELHPRAQIHVLRLILIPINFLCLTYIHSYSIYHYIKWPFLTLTLSPSSPDLIGCVWLQVLPSNVQFLPSNVHFLPSNVHFLPSNVHYLPSNVHFPPPEGVSTLK